ncbi:hypothetical protein [Streptomyces sp. NPDC060243]|uniref:hypothetical protein n=1 Tax=Streptomyces sp. NPDC060243 TaxID=3347081 RepID=UPI00364D8EF1
MTLRPSGLPKIRRQTLRFLNDPTSTIRSKTSEAVTPGLDGLTDTLEHGDLFWVQQDMAALAMHAGSQLVAARWTNADRPSPSGLLYWQGGIGNIDACGVSVPVEACAWGPYEGELLLWLLMSRDRLVDEMAQRNGGTLVSSEVPPLVPITGATVPVTTEPVSMADLSPLLPQPVVAALASSWLLMQQPLLVERTQERADKATVRAVSREGRAVPGVTVVDLRRQYVPQDQDLEETGDGRHYRHRWVVSGHWRTYRSERYSEETRASKQWVPSHVKGPDGAPLLSTEKVNVWRR